MDPDSIKVSNHSTEKKATKFVSLLLVGMILGAAFLVHHAWKTIHVHDSLQQFQNNLNTDEFSSWLDLQIESAKRKVQALEPGTPPPWYTPRYYFEWAPKAKLYSEAQDALSVLRKQKLRWIEKGKAEVESAKGIWNLGVAPILHLLLAFSLFLLMIRWVLRLALIHGLFKWTQL